MKWYNKLYKILESCYLCLRFPFLYPRNRFTGRHRVNALHKLLRKLYINSVQDISITGRLEKNPDIWRNCVRVNDIYIILCKENRKLILSNEVDTIEHDLNSLLWSDTDKFEILGISASETFGGNICVTVHVKTKDESDNTNYGFHYETTKLIKNKFKYFLYKVFDWIDDKILDRILFIPTFTELDAMDSGWRKAFGIQMCKDLKKAAKKDGYTFRIMQLKEKFGFMHLYLDSYGPEVQKVISKYEDLSWNTCIICGKPSTKISYGWICPYCEEHFPKSEHVYKEKINNTWVTNAENEEKI